MPKTIMSIEFDNSAAARHFFHWLDGQGEQNYWEWMHEQEAQQQGPITAVRFNYTAKDLRIVGECGRLDE